MVPPPDQMGDEFPDFDSMTPEEQMAWLESLAKRQGVRDEELTTAADLDIPVPEDAQVDEPGYVPFSINDRPRDEQPEPEPESFAEAESVTEAAEVEDFMAEEAAAEEFMAEYEDEAEAEDYELAEAEAADPMQWLDSLSAQPGEDMGDLDIFAATEDFDLSKELDDIFAEGVDEAEAAESDMQPELEMEALLDQEPESDLELETGDVEAEAVEMPEAELAEDMEQDADIDMPALEGAAVGGDDDPLGGVDPMLWLESLAARQGASASELTTSANLEVDQVADDAVIDEPGYVPFEGSRSAREWQAAQTPAEPEVEPELEFGLELEPEEPEFDVEAAEPELAEAFEEEAFDAREALVEEFFEEVDSEEVGDIVEPEPEAMMDDEDLLAGADPMRWLESLAKRQGAKVEELTTAADLEIPELPEDTVIDEPGYVEYSPFGILPPDQAERAESIRVEPEQPPSMPEMELESLPEGEEEPAFEAEVEAADASLAWLEDLAAEPDEDVAEFLAFEEPEAEAPVEEEAAPPAAGMAGDPLAGMSDDEIAEAQVKGLLTGEQELAWLKRQAAKLAETRQSQELEALAESEIDVTPAQPSELPPWLEAMRDEQEDVAAEEVEEALAEGVLSEELELAEMPDWLEEAAPEAGFDLESLVEEGASELTLDADVDSLWADTAEDELVLQEETVPESELAAFLEGDLVPEPDPLAEALDAEYERRLAGDESEPEWYTEAVAKAAADADEALEAGALAEPEPAEEELAEAALQEMPGWLAEETEEPEPAGVATGDMPDWLRESEGEAVIDDGEVPAWLSEREAEPDTTAEPDWLREFDRVPEEEAVADWLDRELETPSQAALEEKPTPAQPPAPVMSELPETREPALIPGGELFDTYRQRLEQDPADHASRLALARALRADQKLAPSLDQYEVLIESSRLLQDVAEDLTGMVKETPAPRMQRLLGDAFMRQGKLQDALAAYRDALDQL